MPRAKAINRSEVERRPKETLVDPKLIQKLVDLAGAASPESRAELGYKLKSTVSAYRARRLADKQESPARMVAALKPGLKLSKDLLAWLKSLPVGILIELQAGCLEEYLYRIIDRANYWQQHVKAHRPDGEDAASLDLRRSLKDIFTAHCPDLLLEGRAKERKLRDLVAYACQEIGARFPDEKKNRQRFTGEHGSHVREKLMAYVAGVIDEQLRNHEARVALRIRFSRLVDVPI
jgi:hypothetical protein